MRRILISVALSALMATGAVAQQSETLADIRQELSVLYVEIQKLKRELSTTGAAGTPVGGGTMLDRVGAIEGELQRLTGKTEELEFRINRVVKDGTTRIGDLAFRLVELEGGDISQLGETTTLGGDDVTGVPVAPVAPAGNAPQMAVGEEADFGRAQEALAKGDFRAAADLFATFVETYPVGPLTPEARLKKGEALEGAGDLTDAARAYLDAFTTDPTGPMAADTLYHLGAALGRLGQTSEACVTLAEVEARFPASSAVLEAQSSMRNIGCQ